jgi:nuclear pore complex protein Nup107
LNKTIFQYIRRGQLVAAIELCKGCKLYWKAASLRGSILRYEPKNNDELPSGNQNRTLWKAIAAAAASDEALDMYQRAVYAILCGDVRNAFPACQTWEDFLWANVTCLLEYKIQQKLYENAQLLIPAHSVTLKLPFYPFNEKGIFDSLLNHDNLSIRDTTTELFHSFQMHFILNDMHNFFASIQEQLEQVPVDEALDTELMHGLRFLSHLIILLRHLELETGSFNTNYILLRYIKLIQSEGKNELVAMYFEFLPLSEQIQGYAEFLGGITENKSLYYQLGLDHKLDMLEISVYTVSKMLENSLLGQSLPEDIPDVQTTSLDNEISPQDIQLINTLEWLGFEDNQIESLVQFSNSLMRRYLSIYILPSAWPDSLCTSSIGAVFSRRR